ncbi:MAG: LysM peptidoglycan-binding domain-containing protein [Candidatus Atribacteria bacterium]|nr:LysM peptidoglycan-binding domain-containing protein [Candidatus Atribacteria bacterium]
MRRFYNCMMSKSRIPDVILSLLLLLFFISFLSYAENNPFISHEVQKGESIWSISQKYQISKNNLLSINNINENDILSIGQIIKIPQMFSKDDNYLVHYVKKGETLWSISQKYNIQINSIIAINNLNSSDLISVGQSINIPSIQGKNIGKNETSQDLSFKNVSKEDITRPITYVVRKGDNLWNIAQKNGVALTTIAEINSLVNGNNLSIGQKLEIPGIGGGLPETTQTAKPSIITYTIVKGDTLWTISKRYDVKMSLIISTNQLKEISRLSVGQKLKIPITNMDIAKAEGYSKNEEVQEVIYYVKKGESLWNISRNYNVKLETIIAANHISDASKITVGQRLVIPKVPGARSSICDFIWPVRGRVTSLYGQRILNGRTEFHTGIDIGSPTGTKIVAAESGKVSYAGYMRGYGNIVIISHNGGYSTVYAHNSVNLVKKGQSVKKGSAVGKVGRTGNATGPHLHFEIRLSGKPRNPLPYL